MKITDIYSETTPGGQCVKMAMEDGKELSIALTRRRSSTMHLDSIHIYSPESNTPDRVLLPEDINLEIPE